MVQSEGRRGEKGQQEGRTNMEVGLARRLEETRRQGMGGFQVDDC